MTGEEVHANSEERAAVLADLPLDWTRVGQTDISSRPRRLPGDVMEFSSNETDLCIVGTAGQKITVMGSILHSCPKLKSLVLRSHLIIDMEGLDLKENELELLELYDNQIQALQDLHYVGPNLRVLDMSYNVIREMAPVSFCPNLTELYLANNKIKSMEGLSNLSKLRKIDLGANRIRSIDEDELSGLVNLEELWLGKNKIESIGPNSLRCLKKLRRLDIQSNRLTKVEHIEDQASTLEELYLSHNAITDDGLAHGFPLNLSFPNLCMLDVSRNRLTSSDPIAHLTSIEDLWLSGNSISSYENIGSLSCLKKLGCVYLEYNPIDKDYEYRQKVKAIVGETLVQIDAVPIGSNDTINSRSRVEDNVKGILRPNTWTGSLEDMQRLQAQVIERARMQQNGSD